MARGRLLIIASCHPLKAIIVQECHEFLPVGELNDYVLAEGEAESDSAKPEDTTACEQW